jgi:hypothetical protein
MWFMEKHTPELSHIPINIESWEPQWEYDYMFQINKTGVFKLAFLLFTSTTGEHQYEQDYQELAEQKLSTAYRSLHLWITVS